MNIELTKIFREDIYHIRCKWHIIFATYAKKSGQTDVNLTAFLLWRPQGDSNPCRRRERPVSWAGLDDGDMFIVTSLSRFGGPCAT